LGSIDCEQRANDSGGRDRPDAGQAGSTGAAKKAEEDSFGLIRLGVADRDAVDDAGAHHVREKRQPRLAGGLFQVASGAA
jgi:hypothetical protein